ncbi:unnamed protein product [Toxocara canis]|uniref:LysR_substrate domain-containing protein n=1 Tax=Toxocara canis TaxID=6265 RepID=A0A183TYE4_TOXCA|nr:unnamed protein product [Toxocara canis]
MLMSEKEWLALATCCNGERFVDFHRYAGRQPSRPQRSDSMAAVLSTSEVLGSLIIAKLIAKHWPRFAAISKESITVQSIMEHKADLIKFTDDFDICKACDPEFIATLIAKVTV